MGSNPIWGSDFSESTFLLEYHVIIIIIIIIICLLIYFNKPTFVDSQLLKTMYHHLSRFDLKFRSPGNKQNIQNSLVPDV